jgi:hypothetical protein
VLRLCELIRTWVVYQGLTEVDRGLEVALGGLAVQLGLSGGASAQVRTAGSTQRRQQERT